MLQGTRKLSNFEILCPHRVVALRVCVDRVAPGVGHRKHQHVLHGRH